MMSNLCLGEKIDFVKVSWGCEGRKGELVSLFKDQNFVFFFGSLN